jgi:hypothetical protein
VFNDPYSLVEFSKDSKESYGGSSAIENFWGKSAEEFQVAKLEPTPTLKQESNRGSLQKKENIKKDNLWEKMVKKVKSKKQNSSNIKEKKINKTAVFENLNLAKNKPRRSRTSNLAPVSETRPFEGGDLSIQRRSFR